MQDGAINCYVYVQTYWKLKAEFFYDFELELEKNNNPQTNMV